MKLSQQDKRIILILKRTGLKLISRQKKIIFTTCCFNDTILVNTTPNKLYFVFPLEVPKNDFIDFHPYAPAIKYLQHDNNTCVFSRFSSALFDARKHVVEKAISSQFRSSLYCASLGHLDSILFANKVMKDHVRDKFEQNFFYKMVQWEKT